MCVCVYIYIYIYVYIYIYICVYILYIYIHIDIDIDTYRYIYIYMSRYIWPYSYGPPWNQDLAGRHVGGSSQRRHAHGHHLRSGELEGKKGDLT